MTSIIVSPSVQAGGVGKYASSLSEELETERIALKPHLNPIYYVKQVIRIQRNHDPDHINIHLGYQSFGPSGLYFPLFLISTHLTFILYDVPQITVSIHEVWEKDSADDSLFRMAYIMIIHQIMWVLSYKLVFLDSVASKQIYDPPFTSLSKKIVIPHGVPQRQTKELQNAKEEFGYAESDFVVGMVGYIYPRKNPHIFNKLAKEHPNTEFILAGGIRDDSEITEESIHSSLQNLQLTGVLSDTEFHQAFGAIDVMILPYESISQSGILNWCAAYAVPTITSDINYFQEINDNFDCLVLSENTEQIISNVVALRENRRLYAEYREKMKIYANEHAFSETCKLYRDLMN
ncbi:glycosyltransferase [Haloarcula sp. Atlit-120R]|uniref:glycosyltransferase n=1 Tax=Haloarcula sp. Atlit-120R TaxID=2282135 RepID=UPI000EF1C42B|nr:glycosyltransferase [Haloarcula sp. Atlit-120R]RLM33852.1 glycosyltransferase [Haloarcula sp. Atlit-120R]